MIYLTDDLTDDLTDLTDLTDELLMLEFAWQAWHAKQHQAVLMRDGLLRARCLGCEK